MAPQATSDPDQILQALSNDLMSPYCPGRTIAACPSDQARLLEDHILEQAEQGRSREEIEQSLVARFGPEIVGYSPPSVLLYGSLVAGVVALVAVVMVARRWARAAPQAAGPSTAPPTQAELDRLEDALDEVDEL